MRKLLLLQTISFIFFSFTGKSQTLYDNRDFGTVDSFALTITNQHSILQLARTLGRFPDDVDKVRSIFKWITQNIAFDYRFVNKGREITRPSCEEKPDCPEILIKWEEDYLKRVIRSKRAVADGYCRLFKKLCELNYIQAEVIPGYARTRPYQIGNSMSLNHSWNAVLIGTEWYYVDATWAAGYCPENEETGMLLKFVRDYRNYYWLSSIDRFSRNHYPQTNKWVVPPTFSKEQFFNKPHYFSIDVLENLTERKPVTGVLKVKKGDTLHFVFEYKKNISKLQVNSNIYRNPSLWTTIQLTKKKTKVVRDTWAEKKQVYIPFNKNGNTYSFDIVVKDKSLYYLELVFDFKPAIRYRVRVEG